MGLPADSLLGLFFLLELDFNRVSTGVISAAIENGMEKPLLRFFTYEGPRTRGWPGPPNFGSPVAPLKSKVYTKKRMQQL
ncbi:hypothetical protein HPP92_018586 [Vanilla planifolia]|uniref:Uncharacterized protein n=1 Tax=Vanilla planifolia TaxID=51239 RepID=A0A835UPI3_VANPL|nr:hypothetical protein HPP92_018586 [Vanilla planifolia]